MPEKNFDSYTILPFIGMLGAALLGGAASYAKKLQGGAKWKMVDLLIELIIAAFAGLITFLLCQWVGIDQMGTAALTGISGHFSSKAIDLFGSILDSFLKKVNINGK